MEQGNPSYIPEAKKVTVDLVFPLSVTFQIKKFIYLKLY